MNGPTFAQQAARPAAPPRPAPPSRTPPRPALDGVSYPVLAWLQLHWLMIAFCGTLLGGALAGIAWAMLPSEYESYALLRVASAPYSVANNKDPNRSRTEFATYLKTNRELIKYEFVLSAALVRAQSGDDKDFTGPRVAALPTLAAQPDPVRYLDDKLSVTSPEGSEVIKVSLKGSNPDDVQKIVNAVQAAYMAQVIDREMTERNEFLTKVNGVLVSTTNALNLKAGNNPDGPKPLPGGVVQAKHTELAAGPPEKVKAAMQQMTINEVARLTQMVDALPRAIAAQKSKVEQIDKLIKEVQAEPVTPDVTAAVEADPKVRELTIQAQYFRNKYITDRATYANPNVESVTVSLTRADAADEELKALRVKKTAEYDAFRKKGRIDQLTLSQTAAINELRDLTERLQIDTQRLQEKQKELAALPGDPVKEEVKQAGFERKAANIDPSLTVLFADEDVLRGLSTYAAQLRLDQESPKRVSVLQPASTPTQKDGKKQVIATLFAGMMGFVLVGFGAVGYELVVRRLSTLGEAQGSVPTPVVGVVPWLPGQPRTPAAGEALDKLRSYVAQTWLARGATTVAVTSALGDEGKAVTSVGLANSLSAAGYKTLLVDFDLRTPRVHDLCGIPNGFGVCELLRGEADFRQTIQVLPGGLHVLTAGRWSDDARQAAVGGRLEALVARLKEPFDCVVIHAHALLTAADTVEVARRCEVVLVCAMCRETRTPLLKRATERVSAMEIPYSGIVYLGATPHEALC